MDLLSEELDCRQPLPGRTSQPERQRRLLALLVVECGLAQHALQPKFHGLFLCEL
jgi:hypothetical protein